MATYVLFPQNLTVAWLRTMTWMPRPCSRASSSSTYRAAKTRSNSSRCCIQGLSVSRALKNQLHETKPPLLPKPCHTVLSQPSLKATSSGKLLSIPSKEITRLPAQPPGLLEPYPPPPAGAITVQQIEPLKAGPGLTTSQVPGLRTKLRPEKGPGSSYEINTSMT